VNVVKGAIASVLPAAIVAARFLIPGEWDVGFTWFFAITGLIATFIGCLVAAIVVRRRLTRLPVLAVSIIAVVVAAILLAIFPTMPRWPFTGVGFIVSWVLMAAGFTMVFTYGASYRYA
jgi:hypothetical protein